jgi:hypothetical protein
VLGQQVRKGCALRLQIVTGRRHIGDFHTAIGRPA